MENGLPRVFGPRNDSVAAELPGNDGRGEIVGGLEHEVHIELHKVSGDNGVRKGMAMSRPEAGLVGLAMLIGEYAKLTGLQVFEVLSRLAVVMLAPGEPEAGGEVDGHG